MRLMILPAALAFAVLCAPVMAAPQIKLQVGITGNDTLTGLDDPVTVARKPEVSKLLQNIADKPRSAEYIKTALKGSDVDLKRLLSLGILKKFKGAYAINFNYLTLEDQKRLVRALTPYADRLAQTYRDRWGEFRKIFRSYNVPGVPEGEVAYTVLGAISLDWDGLDVTAEKDLRITAQNLPAGRSFVLWAKEESPEVNVKELYWGSHNDTINGIRFTSFGDHYTFPRLAFPDLLWDAAIRAASVKEATHDFRVSFYEVLEPYYLKDLLRDTGLILRQLRTGTQTAKSVAGATGLEPGRAGAILNLLKELQYAEEKNGSFALATPFYSTADKPMIDKARALSRQIMSDWLDSNSAGIKTALGDLTAIKYGVPYKQLYTEIWHYIFGLANRSLVKSGHFANPYADGRLSKAIIPFAFDLDVVEAETGGKK